MSTSQQNIDMRTMPRPISSSPLHAIGLTAALLLSLWSAQVEAAGKTGTIRYKVKAGDTCTRVARQLYDDPRFYKIIHLYNRKVCALPTALKPGTRLRLPHPDAVREAVRKTGGRMDQLKKQLKPPPTKPKPKPKPRGPDAKITARRNDVDARAPFEKRWSMAKIGQDLWRAWRVNSQDDSSAEVTFTVNDAQLQVRENTLVIIYGPMTTRSRRRAARAELEHGTLATRLGELAGEERSTEIQTPSAEVGVTGGRAVIGVRRDGTTQVSNHTSKSVEVGPRPKPGKKRRRRKRVKLARGMGVTIKKNRPIPRPRPLPGIPKWKIANPMRVMHLHGSSIVRANWSAAKQAALYRFELSPDSRGRELLHAGLAPASITRVELKDLRPGTYFVHLSAKSREGLEGKPASPLRVDVLPFEISLLAPQKRRVEDMRDAFRSGRAQAPRQGAPAKTGDAAARGGKPAVVASMDPPAKTPKLAPITVGARLNAPAGGACALDEGKERKPSLVFQTPGTRTLRCVDAKGNPIEPHTIEVAPVAVHPMSFATGVPVGLIPGEPREVAFALSVETEAVSLKLPEGVTSGPISRTAAGYWSTTLTATKQARFDQTVTVQLKSHGAETPVSSFRIERRKPVKMAPREVFHPSIEGGAFLRLGGLGQLAPDGQALTGGPRFGLRVGVPLLKGAGVELDLDTASIGLENDSRASVRAFGVRLAGVYQFSSGDWRPFARLGGGADLFLKDSEHFATSPALLGGLGLTRQLDNNVYLRADLTEQFYPGGRPDEGVFTTSFGLGFMAEF